MLNCWKHKFIIQCFFTHTLLLQPKCPNLDSSFYSTSCYSFNVFQWAFWLISYFCLFTICNRCFLMVYYFQSPADLNQFYIVESDTVKRNYIQLWSSFSSMLSIIKYLSSAAVVTFTALCINIVFFIQDIHNLVKCIVDRWIQIWTFW